MRAAPAFPFCQEKRKKQAGTLSFLIFIAKFGAVAVGSPAETPREIMENITKKLKSAYNPIQLFNSLKTTIMRKNTTLSRSLLLTAALALGGTTATAQTPTYDASAPVLTVDDLTDGNYVLNIHNTSGKTSPDATGLIYYDQEDASNQRRYRAIYDFSFENGQISDDRYVWTLDWNDEHTAFTLQNASFPDIYFSLSTHQNNKGRGDMTPGGTTALYEPVAIEGVEGRFFLKVANPAEGSMTPLFLFTNNAESGYKNISYWNADPQPNANSGGVQIEFFKVTGSFEYVDITYNYQIDGQTVSTEQFETFIGAELPTPTLPDYVTATNAPEGTVEAGTTEYTIDCTVNFPFEVSPAPVGGQFAEDTKWYALDIRSGKYARMAEEGSQYSVLTHNTVVDLNENIYWCFTKGDGFTVNVYNLAAGASAPMAMNASNEAIFDATAQDFNVVQNGSKFLLGIPGTGNYINDIGNGSETSHFGVYTSNTDDGSSFIAKPASNIVASLSERVGGYTADATASFLTSPTTSGLQALCAKAGSLERIALDPTKLYRIQNLARKASTGNTNDVGNGGYLEVTDKTVTEYTVDMAAIDTDPSRATALWQIQPIEGQDGHFRLYNPNAGVYVGSVVEDSYLTTATSVDEAGNISLVSLGQAQYRLRNEQNDGPLHASGPNANNKAGIQIYGGELNSPSAWYLIPAETIDVTIGEAGYATINLPVAVQLPEGLTAYTTKEETADAVKLTEIEGNVLPAGSPVLLGGKEGTYTLTLLPADQSEALTTGFGGTLMATAVPDDVNAYILAKKEGDAEAKFYQLAESEPIYAPLYYRLVTRATDGRAGRAIELLNDASTDILGVAGNVSKGAAVGVLWSNTVEENDDYQLWQFVPDPEGSGKYAMVCKAQPEGSVNPTPTATATTGRWDYDNDQKHYNFNLNKSGTADGVDYYYITSDQTDSQWFMNSAGDGQAFSINLYNDFATSSNAGYFNFNVVEYDTDNVIDTDPTPRTIAANKAYYVSTLATGEALSLSFGGPAVGIDQIATPGAEKAQTYYDLQGRRVLYPSNGIYVTGDGQKVFIK